MSETARLAVFLAAVLAIWTSMHLYVGHRLWRLPGVSAPGVRPALVAAGVLLMLAYPLGRVLDRLGWRAAGHALELVGAQWMGVLFLVLTTLVLVDLLTGLGFWFKPWVPAARLGAAALALALAAVATIQGLRAPALRHAEVRLAGLPEAAAGLRVAHLSDLHLGPLLGERWLDGRVAQVLAERPDLVVITGDLVDSDSRHVESMLPALQRLAAPLGVWAVSGNHEFYAGIEASLSLMERAGFEVLRDRAVEVAPGLVLAGVDDLTARRQLGIGGDVLGAALDGRPAGATILLSHTPWLAAEAARRGVGLMLSGHTHDGQIWPFGLLVRLQYPLVGGRYEVDGMQVLVSRGTGGWGPRMRLWRRAEIWLLTLQPAA
ncbi:MAG TPA: metallophosphoesterase [Thermoanaerobaculaceae bacterium]|nr:metallophosphoesterase [Thermoanaerobaculaceae bacterium]HRS14902.1 metallophosphoesterase [Thermoanaerobaculaceae bacterium]